MADFGDADGDGDIDAVVTSYGSDLRGTNSGAAWLQYGALSGTIRLDTDYDARWYGSASDQCGAAAGLGDVNADGLDDIVIGCGNNDRGSVSNRGTVSIFYGF